MALEGNKKRQERMRIDYQQAQLPFSGPPLYGSAPAVLSHSSVPCTLPVTSTSSPKPHVIGASTNMVSRDALI